MATKKKTATPEQASAEGLISLSLKDNATGERVANLPPMSAKERVLLYLWGYSGSNPDRKAEIMESHEVLKKGLKDLKVLNIDREKGTFDLNVYAKPNYNQELIDRHLNTPWVKVAIAELYGFKKEFLKAQEVDPLRPPFVKVAMHGVRQLIGRKRPQTAMTFEVPPAEVDSYVDQAGMLITPQDRERLLKGYGADLTVTQHSVLLAVLERMTPSNYRGEWQEERKEVLTRAGVNPPGGGLPEVMKKALVNVEKFPVVRLRLHEVVELAGYSNGAQKDKLEVKQALEDLNTTPYTFFYERLKWKEYKGWKKPEEDKNKRFVTEGVKTVGSILYVKEIVDLQSGQLDYYEISPSLPFLEHVTEAYGSRGGYFLMMPTGLLEKIRKVVGPGRRVTPHYYTFLYWIGEKYQERTSNAGKKNSSGLVVREHFEHIAQIVRMPESIWRRKRVKAVERLESIYQAAKDLGYLKSYSMGTDGIVTLELDPSGPFYRPKKERELPPGAEG